MDLATARVRIRRITLPAVNAGDAYKYVKEAVRAYPELYFASAVVLGEGDSESIVLPRLARALGQTFDQRFVSVVPLGGRHVNHFWRLLNELEIPHLTLLDLDRERFGGGWSRIHYAINQLITFVPNSSAANFGITAQQLAEMPTWPLDNPQGLSNWATSLEARGIFFSSPLDLDFAMLQGFENAYHEAKTGPGPNIPAAEEPLAERVSRAIRAVLKSEGGSGATYTAAEKTAFIWYQYLFLNRGKPATHLLALTKVTDQQIQINIPQVLRRLLDRVNTILNPQPNAPPPPPQVA